MMNEMKGWIGLLTVLLTSRLLQGQDYKYSQQFGGLIYADPDSAGYRQCAYWELPDGTHLHSECDPYNMERCGETARFIYQCCSGFEEDPNTFGGYRRQQPVKCSRMISPYNECAETILKSAEVAPFSPDLSAVSELKNEAAEGPFTIFAPKMGEDDGGRAVLPGSPYCELVELVTRGLKFSLSFFPPDSPIEASEHVVRGRFYAEDLKEGMELETVDGRRKLYVSRFAYGVLGIDCAEITDVDLECRSGVIHKLRHPLNGRGTFTNTDRTSVMSLLQSHPETQAFANDLPSDLKRDLGAVYSGKRYTVLAPRAQAWNDIKRQFTGEKLQQIAARHVLPNQVCSGALISKMNQKSNVLGDKVKIICTIDKQSSQEKRYIMTECDEEINLIETDMAAANGVVHLLEKAITPLTMKMLLENEKCAKALKVNEFVKLMRECDLYIDDNGKYAVILPRDESFQWWSSYEQFREEYQRFQVDKEYRCKVARYHIVKSNDKLDSMESFASHTMGHRTNNKNDYLYETTYFTKTPQGPMLNFHYSPIPDMTALTVDNMAIYITPRINVPPEKNLTDILQERPDTTLMNRKTIEAEMDVKHFQKNAPKNLYLVTTDDGWKDPRASPQSLNPYRPENTMYQGETLEKFLLLHHVPLYLWGGDIGYFPPNSVHKFMSSAGVELTFWRDASGVMRIGHDEMPRDQWPKVVKWNLPARDGIMWLLDGILQCPSILCPLYAEDIDYYDMFVAACQTAHLPGEASPADDFRKKPTDVANRHPDDCTVVLQLSEKSMRYVEA
ncbi:fasciclin domain protein [Opisthorchis viverrini]|uniref:Fasciclin domain protein n=1 Tax=Opisthorchis viverrini TaxID=6198 RepID=A0A1S8XA91_OPIVI|nr:fasciclin domain protein [Opisthorchis viverrini]